MAKEELVLDVKSNIKSVTKETDKLGKSLEKATDESKDLGEGLEDAGEQGKKGFQKITGGVAAFGKALKAAGVGLLITAFIALKDAVGQNQRVLNAANTALTTMSTTFNQLVQSLINVFTWATASSERFNGLTKVLKGVADMGIAPLKLAFLQIKQAITIASLAWEKSFFGGGDEDKIKELNTSLQETNAEIKKTALDSLQSGKDIFTNFGDAIGEVGSLGKKIVNEISKISIASNFEQAKATTEAKNSAALAAAQIQGLIEENDLLAEKQRQIRDDERKTFAERIEANDELGRILEKQEVEMLKLADITVNAAKLEADANKENIQLQAAYQTALNERAAVEAQVAGFKSEQLVNEAALQRELLAAQNEVRAEGLSNTERELAELEAAYKLKLDMARKSGMDISAITKQYEKQKSQVVAAGVETQLAAYSQLAGALSALAGDNKALAIAQAVMDTYAGANKAFAEGGTLGFVTGAAIIAQGLANVKEIMKTEVPGGGVGGMSAGSIATTQATPPAPQMMGGSFELGGGVKPDPVQAFVVSDDITNNQDKLAAIRRRATI